ncbi:tetratricopeptide repeat protein [Rufibacter soli]
MKYCLLTCLFLAFSPWQGLQRIALRNQYAQQAGIAYGQKDYRQAAFLYERVRQTEGNSVPTTSVQINLAHSYFQLHDYSRASPIYRSLMKSPNPRLQSMVATQLAAIEVEEGNFTRALAYCKQAMTTDETNQAARYNYELLQKYLLLHPEKRQLPPPPPRTKSPERAQGGARKSDSEGSSSAGKDGPSKAGGSGGTNAGGTNSESGPTGENQRQERGDSPGQNQGQSNTESSQPSSGSGNQRSSQEAQASDAQLQTRFDRLKKLQLSPEKARQLLDAMRQEEAQYLQQLPRKSTGKRDKNLPDW